MTRAIYCLSVGAAVRTSTFLRCCSLILWLNTNLTAILVRYKVVSVDDLALHFRLGGPYFKIML